MFVPLTRGNQKERTKSPFLRVNKTRISFSLGVIEKYKLQDLQLIGLEVDYKNRLIGLDLLAHDILLYKRRWSSPVLETSQLPFVKKLKIGSYEEIPSNREGFAIFRWVAPVESMDSVKNIIYGD